MFTMMPSSPDVIRRRNLGLALLNQLDAVQSDAARYAVLSTFNVDLIKPLLCEALDRAGLAARVHLAPFGQLVGQILDQRAEIYRQRCDAVVVIPAVEDLLAPLYERPGSFSLTEATAYVEGQAAQLRSAIDVLLKRLPGAVCYLVVIGPDNAPAPAVLDPAAVERGQVHVQKMLEALRHMGAVSPRVIVVDWDWSVRGAGQSAARDARLWYLARMRLAPMGLAGVADLVAQHAAAYAGRTRKVAAFDLDDTLWGGIVGEVGLQGLTLGEEGIGLAFQDFQRELLKLRDLGVVLAACSKNNPDDAWEVFDRHPGMILRREHLAAARVNWQDKAANLRELAEELNLGIDSFVFLDDNPVERDWVRNALPEVLVPELPADPVDRPAALRGAACFQRILVTSADRQRAETYQAQGHRTQLRSAAATLDEFLQSLQQVVMIEPVTAGSLARAAQLCQRTNQFNLTTHRYTAADIQRMMEDASMDVVTLAVKDRYGDSGITGLAILHYDAESAEIDTFLLSCRVLGRRIEDALLAFLAARARQRGAHRLLGRYLPTAKNQQVATFYADRGFAPLDGERFELDLNSARVESPDYVAVRSPQSA